MILCIYVHIFLDRCGQVCGFFFFFWVGQGVDLQLRILHVSGASCPVPSELSGAVDNLEIRQNSEFFTAQIGTGLIIGEIDLIHFITLVLT